MERIFLSLKSKEEDKKYYSEFTKESLNRLIYLLFFLISINILLLAEESRKQVNVLENRKITTGGGFIITYGITFLLIKLIRRYSKSLSEKNRYIANRLPCYLFMIQTPYIITLLITFLNNNFEEETGILYMSVIMYFISSSILGIWWISLLIQLPANLIYYMTLFQKKNEDNPEMNKQIDTVITVAIFAFAIAVASSYISEKQLKFNFQMKEELHVEKEKIRDLFEMFPITIIKINRQTKETQLNQKAKDLFQEFNCSFEEFSRKTLLKNQQGGSLWQEIVYEMNSLEKKNYGAEKNKNRDFVQIADYTFTYLRAGKHKTIDYVIQFSQRPSMPDEVLITLQKKNKQRKLKEEQLANMYKNNLIKSLSHDLKTPLNGVITLLNGFPREEKLKNNFQLIYMSAQFLHFKLKDMLDYSQIETGLFVLKQESICLYNFFASILNLCQPQAELEEVFLSQKIDRRIPYSIIGDKDRIEQIIVHLLQNAIKYTPKGGRIILLAELVEGGLKLGVKDTGIGITKLQSKSLFSFFYQGSEALSENRAIEEEVKENFQKKPKNLIINKRNQMNIIQNNTFQGLGLQITQKIVKSLNSKLRIKSQKFHKGTEFSFVLENYCQREGNIAVLGSNNERRLSFKEIYPSPRNFEEVKDESSILRSESCEEILTTHMYDFGDQDECNVEEIFVFKKLASYKLPKGLPKQLVNSKFKTSRPENEYRALVVDDNGVNRIAISGLLRRQGITVTQNMDGLEAVEEMKKQIRRYKIQKDKTMLFNYIFMDLNMPNMDGIEATMLINNMLDEENIKIPIFALTAYDTNQLKNHCLSHGFAQYLVKPIKQDDLMNVLKKYQDFR